jgi:hypothetical protein
MTKEENRVAAAGIEQLGINGLVLHRQMILSRPMTNIMATAGQETIR